MFFRAASLKTKLRADKFFCSSVSCPNFALSMDMLCVSSESIIVRPALFLNLCQACFASSNTKSRFVSVPKEVGTWVSIQFAGPESSTALRLGFTDKYQMIENTLIA